MANVRYSLIPKALIKPLQFSCRFKGNKAIVPNDEEHGDANGAC